MIPVFTRNCLAFGPAMADGAFVFDCVWIVPQAFKPSETCLGRFLVGDASPAIEDTISR